MRYDWYPHRFADIILNSDYALKQEIEWVIQSVSLEDVLARFEQENEHLKSSGCKESQEKQSTINANLENEFAKSHCAYFACWAYWLVH